MKLLKTAVLFFFFALTVQISADQAIFNLTCRHLKLFLDSSSGDFTGCIGRYLRGPTIQYSDELLCYADLSSLTGVTVTNVKFKFYVSSVFNGTASNSASVVLYEQQNAPYNSNAVYLTYPKTTWPNSVGSLTLTSNEPAGYKEITSSDLITLIKAYASGAKLNKGLILGAQCDYWNYYFNISLVTYKVQLIVDYVPFNAAPVATISPTTGTVEVGSVLTGHYTYSDAENNPEGASIFNWYSAATSTGTYLKIDGANNITYTLQDADYQKYIKFQVTPVASIGTSPGTAVQSAFVGPVAGVLYKYPIACGAGDNMKVDGRVRVGKQGVTITNPQGNTEEKYTIVQDSLIEMHKIITTSYPDVDTTFGINIDTRRGLLIKQQDGSGLYTTQINGKFIDIKSGGGDWLTLRRSLDNGYWHINNPQTTQDRMEIGYTDNANVDHWGYFCITNDGRIGVGTSAPATGIKMDVNGIVQATAFKVGNWILDEAPDYVFKEGYDLRSLKNVQKYIDKNGHLPDVPSAEQMKEDGLDLVKMNMILLRKVEELTLYGIEQNKKLEKQQADIDALKRQVK